MIKIVAKMPVKPENVTAFIETAAELVKKSRQEEGNVFYSLNQLKGNESTLTFIECWKDPLFH